MSRYKELKQAKDGKQLKINLDLIEAVDRPVTHEGKWVVHLFTTNGSCMWIECASEKEANKLYKSF